MSYAKEELHEAVHSRLAGWRAWAFRHAAIAAVIPMAAGPAGAGINQHVFWDDKASTALFARALLHPGRLDAWDGRNVNSFRGGSKLGRTSAELRRHSLAALYCRRRDGDAGRSHLSQSIRRHLGVTDRIHDIFMAHVVLERSGVMPVVGELVAGGVPEHVRMDREWKPCRFPGPGDRFSGILQS